MEIFISNDMTTENNFYLPRLQAAYQYLRNIGKIHTKKELAEAINWRNTHLSSAFNGDPSRLTRGLMEAIWEAFPVFNARWMIYGEGSMLKTAPDEVAEDEDEADDARSGNMVPLLPASAFAGSVVGFMPDAVSLKQCEMITTPVPGAEMAIPITGDSMEPNYPNGSIAYIRQINEASFIPWGHTVVLDTKNGAFIKRIYPDNEEPEYVWAKSINPDYPPMHIPKESIYRIFRVLATSRIYTTM